MSSRNSTGYAPKPAMVVDTYHAFSKTSDPRNQIEFPPSERDPVSRRKYERQLNHTLKSCSTTYLVTNKRQVPVPKSQEPTRSQRAQTTQKGYNLNQSQINTEPKSSKITDTQIKSPPSERDPTSRLSKRQLTDTLTECSATSLVTNKRQEPVLLSQEPTSSQGAQSTHPGSKFVTPKRERLTRSGLLSSPRASPAQYSGTKGDRASDPWHTDAKPDGRTSARETLTGSD